MSLSSRLIHETAHVGTVWHAKNIINDRICCHEQNEGFADLTKAPVPTPLPLLSRAGSKPTSADDRVLY